jgi:hypothetical protein
MPNKLKFKSVVAITPCELKGHAPEPGNGVAANPAEVQTIKISCIRLDERLQNRTAIDQEIVADWASLMRAGADFPLITVWWDGENYWLSDGFHRIAAAARAGRTEIRAEVRQGSFADAQWDSYGVNAAHGIRRTRSESEAVIRRALQHPNALKLTDVLISTHLHIPRATIQYWRKKLSCQSWQDAGVRTVTRNGTTYDLAVANLGKRGTRAKPRRNLREELADIRKQASEPARELLNDVEKWALGLASPTRFLEVLENFLRRKGVLPQNNGSQQPQPAKLEAVH